MSAEEMKAENATLRALLFSVHIGPDAYGDDGEMQCNACRIDFKRDSADEIARKLREIGLWVLAESQAAR